MSCAPIPRIAALALVAVLALLVVLPPVAAADDPRQPRAFTVRYRSLTDAADLVTSVLSADGTVTLKPRLNLLVVEDRTSVLNRVAALLASFDLPPRSVEVTLGLFQGTRRPPEASEPPAPRRPVIDLPSLEFTRWTSYEPLGSRSLTAVEGHEVVTQLSADYRVVFLIEFVDERQGMVKFKRFTLERVTTAADGAERVEHFYSMAATIDAGKQNIIGAARDPRAERALFLTVLAQPR